MTPSLSIAVVDPDPVTRDDLTGILESLDEVVLGGVHVDYRSACRALSTAPPELTIVAVDTDREDALTLVQAIKRAKPAALVVPASRRVEADEILRFLRAGATDYLHLPACREDVQALLARLPSRLVAQAGSSDRENGHIVAITGASGGVGTSSLAVNLAAILAEDRVTKVALLDLDLLFGSVAASLNLGSSQGILDVLENADRLDHHLLLRSLIHHGPTNLHVLTAPEAIEDIGRVEPEPLGRVLTMLTELFDYVLVDTGKALHVTDMLALERSRRILLVVQSDLVSLYHSARLLGLFRRLDRLDDRTRVVLNRAGSDAGSISVRKVEGTLGLPVFAQVPNAFRAFQDARTYGSPIDRRGPAKRARTALEDLAASVRAEFEVRAATTTAAPNGRRGRFWSTVAVEKPAMYRPATV